MSNINIKFNQIEFAEITESGHGLPELTVVYKMEYNEKKLTILVNNKEISTFNGNMADYIWNKIMNKKETKPLTKEDIIELACKTTNVQPSEIYRKTRDGKIVVARQLAMWKLYDYFKDEKMSLASIASLFNQGHCNALHAYKMMQKSKG